MEATHEVQYVGNEDAYVEMSKAVKSRKLYTINRHKIGNVPLDRVRGKLITFSEDQSHGDDVVSYYKTFELPHCQGAANKDIVRDWSDMLNSYIECFPQPNDANGLFVTQMHVQVDGVTVRRYSKGIENAASIFNTHLVDWLKGDQGRTKAMNIIEVDYYQSSFCKLHR